MAGQLDTAEAKNAHRKARASFLSPSPLSAALLAQRRGRQNATCLGGGSRLWS